MYRMLRNRSKNQQELDSIFYLILWACLIACLQPSTEENQTMDLGKLQTDSTQIDQPSFNDNR